MGPSAVSIADGGCGLWRVRWAALGITLMLAWNVGLRSPCARAGSAPSEHEIKAAFILNFIKFTTWPEDTFKTPNAPIRIGVLGRDPMEEALSVILAEKQVGGRGFEVDRVPDGRDLERFHLIVVPETETGWMRDREGVRRGVLVVGEASGFIEKGGMIGFVREGKRLRFEVGLDASERAGLRFSSHLLRLAHRVLQGGRERR